MYSYKNKKPLDYYNDLEKKEIEMDLCQVFRHIFWKDVISPYLNLFQFPFDKQKYFY